MCYRKIAGGQGQHLVGAATALSLVWALTVAVPSAAADEPGPGRPKITVNKADPEVARAQPKTSLTRPRAEVLQGTARAISRVYVDGDAGNDTADGASDSTAVQTMTRAYELVSDGGTIVVIGDTTFGGSDTAPWVVPARSVVITGEGTQAALTMFGNVYLQGDTTFRDITLVNAYSGRKLSADGHRLVFGQGFDLVDKDSITGTSLIVIGGGVYGAAGLNTTQFPPGSNLVFESGTFGAVFAGPSVDLAVGPSNPLALQLDGEYRVSVGGTATIRDIHGGADIDAVALTSMELSGSTVVDISSSGATVGNVFGGGYYGYGRSAGAQYKQERTTINVSAGTVDWVFGGSLMLGGDADHRVGETVLNLSGEGQVSKGIYAGGMTLGSGSSTVRNLNRVEKMSIVTSTPQSATIRSSGATQAYTGTPSGQEAVQTGTLEVTLTASGSVGDLRTAVEVGGKHAATDAEDKIITFAAGSHAALPAGYSTLRIVEGGHPKVATTTALDRVMSDGAAGNRIEFVQQNLGDDLPRLEVAATMLASTPLQVDIVAAGSLDDLVGQAVAVFDDQSQLDPTRFELRPDNPALEALALAARDGALRIVAREPMPTVFIDFGAEKLTGFISGALYTVGGALVTVDGTALDIDDSWFGGDLIIAKMVRATTGTRLSQNLSVPPRPSAPQDLAGVAETLSGLADGRIAGTTTACEFRPVGEGTWTPCSEPEITGLASGSYQVRSRATATQFAGVPAVVRVPVGPDPVRYQVLEHFGTWTGVGASTAVVDRNPDGFLRLMRGGHEVDPASYTVSRGSTVLTLDVSYLRTLAAGDHAFVAEYVDGSSEPIHLTVALPTRTTATEDTPLAVTGPGYLGSLLLAGALLIVVGTVVRARTRRGGDRTTG